MLVAAEVSITVSKGINMAEIIVERGNEVRFRRVLTPARVIPAPGLLKRGEKDEEGLADSPDFGSLSPSFA